MASDKGAKLSPEPSLADDCWNIRGTYGTRACPELAQFVHCRNCAVYSNAGAMLLARSVPEDYRRDWTAHISRQKPPARYHNFSAVLFRVTREWLAIPTPVLQEIADYRCVHSLPHRRGGAIMGLVNVRGELTVCVSLRSLLGLEEQAGDTGRLTGLRRLLITSWGGYRFALGADEVYGTHRFHLRDLMALPATLRGARDHFTRGTFLWQEKTVGLLDPDLLFPKLNASMS